jgi:hypothetical protein
VEDSRRWVVTTVLREEGVGTLYATPILSRDAALRTPPRCLGREKYHANGPRHGREDNYLGDGCIQQTI